MGRPDLRIALLLALIAAALYAPTLGYDFTSWDDPEYVIENPLIRSLDPGAIREVFSHFYLANYAPIHLLAYALLHAAVGVAPWAYHALNLALHAGCTALAFLLLRRLELPRAGAALGSAIFLAHPGQVEVVAWVNQTKTLLAAFFGMLSLLTLLHYRERRGSGGSAVTYWSSVLLFAFALLSKPQAVAFPAVFFCLERAMGDRPRRLPIALWAPFGLLAACGAWTAILAQASAGAVKAYGPMGLWGNVLGSLVILLRYLRTALFPVDLSVVYELRPVLSVVEPRVIGASLLLAAIAGAAWKGRASGSRPWHALGFFVAPLVPVLGWVPLNMPMADRYLYLSLFAVGWIIRGAAGGLGRWGRTAIWTVPLLLALLALERMPMWRNGETLWEAQVRDHSDSPHAWIGRGSYRFHQGDPTGAEADFRRAIALDGQDHESWTNLGLAMNRQGRTEEAVQAWRRALVLEPRADWPRLLIARDHSRRGERAAARALLDAVIQGRPDFAMAYLYRAAARERTGDGPGAEADLSRAAGLDPFLADARESLGRLREARGDYQGARTAYTEFLKVWAGDPARADRVRQRLEGLPREDPG